MLGSDTEEGRVYFGYLGICRDFIEDLDRNAPILDAGSGDGRFLRVLQEVGFRNIHATDYSERALAFAKLFVPGVETAVADLAKLPYADQSFDRVFLIETLEHIIPDMIPAIVREFARILRPEGELIITVPSTLLPVSKKHYQHFSADSLAAAVSPEFTPEEVIGQNYAGLRLLKALYLLIDNRWVSLPTLARWYNRVVWPRCFNRSVPGRGRRIIGRFKKSVS
jgi:SAM-dependent methyltransferase